MLACMVAPSATGSPLPIRVLAFGLHGHAHSVSVLADAGHVDLVLSHDERHDHDHGALQHREDLPPSLAEGDHVVHLAGADAIGAAPRRDAAPAVPPPAPWYAAPFPVPAVARILHPAAHPDGLGARHLCTVLRL